MPMLAQAQAQFRMRLQMHQNSFRNVCEMPWSILTTVILLDCHQPPEIPETTLLPPEHPQQIMMMMVAVPMRQLWRWTIRTKRARARSRSARARALMMSPASASFHHESELNQIGTGKKINLCACVPGWASWLTLQLATVQCS